jgi:hypothetical protein
MNTKYSLLFGLLFLCMILMISYHSRQEGFKGFSIMPQYISDSHLFPTNLINKEESVNKEDSMHQEDSMHKGTLTATSTPVDIGIKSSISPIHIIPPIPPTPLIPPTDPTNLKPHIPLIPPIPPTPISPTPIPPTPTDPTDPTDSTDSTDPTDLLTSSSGGSADIVAPTAPAPAPAPAPASAPVAPPIVRPVLLPSDPRNSRQCTIKSTKLPIFACKQREYVSAIISNDDKSGYDYKCCRIKDGEQGEQGLKGLLKGSKGPMGPKGVDGIVGPKGDMGKRGPRGDRGKEARWAPTDPYTNERTIELLALQQHIRNFLSKNEVQPTTILPTPFIAQGMEYNMYGQK